MRVNFALSVLFLALFPLTVGAQNHSPLGVVIESTERNSGKSSTVHLRNISGKEVTAFNVAVEETFADGKTDKRSAHTEDMLGAFLMKGKAFSPNSTFDVQMGGPDFQIPAPVDSRVVVDMVIYADGTAQVQNRDRFKDIMDQRSAHFRTLEKVDDAIEAVLADPGAEHPTSNVAARLKAMLDEEEKKVDADKKAVIYGNGSPGEWGLQQEIRNRTRFVNRNEEAPLDRMLKNNKSEIEKLRPHVQVAEIQ